MALIRQALDGHLTDHHRFTIQVSLDHMEHLEQLIVRLDQRIGEHHGSVSKGVRTPADHSRPGGASAATVLAEIGPDMCKRSTNRVLSEA
jgi:transposase